MSNSSRNTGNAAPDEFVRLFMAHQRRLLSFVLSLQPDLADAEDIVQEVSKLLWEKFSEFQPGTDFGAWALKVARLKVLEFRRSKGRQPYFLSDEFVNQLADDAAARAQHVAARHQALDGCLQKLDAAQQDLLAARYTQGSKLDELARKFGRSVVTIRKMLKRTYSALADCIERKLAEEGH